MLQIKMSDSPWLDEESLKKSLEHSTDEVEIEVRIRDIYRSSSLEEIANNWLLALYVSESLAECSESAECDFEEREAGVGYFKLILKKVDAQKLKQTYFELGSAFDEDDVEASVLIYDEASDWFDQAQSSGTIRFSELKDIYLSELNRFKESGEFYSEG